MNKILNIPQNTEVLHKELDLIQNCIKKCEDRSILLKGWSIGLIGIICGINSSSIFIFNPKATPISLSILLTVNSLFYLLAINNNKKKWLYTKLYEWTINNRQFDKDEPWEFVYDLNYKRFEDKLPEFSSSKFNSTFFSITWIFILSLMIWHTINGIDNSNMEKSKLQNQKDSSLIKK